MSRNKAIETPLPEGSTIGLVGGGQLGMFFTQAAQRLGYRVCCFCNREDEPAAQFADEVISGPFAELESIQRLISKSDAVTYEFESIPAETLSLISKKKPLLPSLKVIGTTQDRALEKVFLTNNQIPTPGFCVVESFDDLLFGIKVLETATVLKTARDGYDGKGQWKLRGNESQEAFEDIWEQVAGRKCTLEKLINLQKEVSVIVASDQHGNIETIGPICNQHVNHILDTSWIEPETDSVLANRAVELATKIASRLGLVGTLCVEFFIDADGEILVNEIAPRPHNSGHLTIDAFSLSQFDLQALAVSGQKISKPVEVQPAVMINLLGDLWQDEEPDFENIAAEIDCDVRLHLYGKKSPRPGRKMGHATFLADSLSQTVECAKRFRERLQAPPVTNKIS